MTAKNDGIMCHFLIHSKKLIELLKAAESSIGNGHDDVQILISAVDPYDYGSPGPWILITDSTGADEIHAQIKGIDLMVCTDDGNIHEYIRKANGHPARCVCKECRDNAYQAGDYPKELPVELL